MRGASPLGRAVSGDEVTLDAASLRQLAVDVAPLARLDLAAGYRSLHPDPDHVGGAGGAAPESTPLERAADAGDLGRARIAWRRAMSCPAAVRRTLAWVAEAAGAVVDVDAWAHAVALALGPGALVDRAARLDEIHERARLSRAAIARRVTRRAGMTAEDSEALSKATRERDALHAALRDASDDLVAWGRGALGRALEAWASTSP